MLGHVLRRDPKHILREVTCDDMPQRPDRGYKGVGRPRLNWFEDNLARAHLQIGIVDQGPDGPIYTGHAQFMPFDHANEEHIRDLKRAALDREF